MREILFKAKEIGYGKMWIVGDYSAETSTQYPCIREVGSDIYTVINPETLCQYTGKCDKNGKKIFEGDIIRSPKNKVYDTEDNVVVFENCGFVAKCKWLTVTPEWFEDCEIIGNIFDKE